MAFTIVSSGSTVSNAVLNNGDIQQITSSGTTISTVINSGGQQNVYGNNGVPGLASGTTVNDGGMQDVSAGAAYATLVNAGGSQVVENNGVAYTVVVSGAGANTTARAGGRTNNVTLSDGASDVAATGGFTSNIAVQSGTLLNISGGTAYAAVVTNAGSIVLDSGYDYNAVVSSGGVLTENGGSDNSTVVSSGGVQYVLGGYTYAGSVQNGGVQIVRSGGTASSITVAFGGSQTVSSGGSANYNAINNGGVQTLSSGGAGNYNTINSGGTEYVGGGATTLSATIQAGGSANVASGAVTTLSIVNGGTETVSSGGRANAARIYASGIEAVQSGGLVSGTIIYNGTLLDAGTVSNTLLSGGSLRVQSGGTTTVETISAGSIIVSSGGSASSTTIVGGSEVVQAGGSDRATAIYYTGVQTVAGTAVNASLVSGGHQYVSGGTTTGTVVNSGGIETVQVGGTASNVTVNSGGTETVTSGGLVVGVTVNTGGSETVSSGAAVSSATIANGTQSILAGGSVDTAVLTGSGLQSVIGMATGTVVSSGASQVVYGVAVGTTVSAGGQELVSSGGAATATAVSAGGLVRVSSGGTTTAAVLTSGTETVYSGGSAASTNVGPGGLLTLSGAAATATVVSSGGSAVAVSGTLSGGTLLAGGVQTVSSGAIAADTLISGGVENVLSSGRDLRATVGSGGTLNVFGLGVTSAVVVTTGGLETVLNAGVASATVLSGGTQAVSSGGVASGGTVGAGGLQLVSGGGMAAAATITSGGEEDVLSGGVASAASVQGGGLQTVSSGGAAAATTVSSGGTQTVLSGGTATFTTLAAGGSLVNHGTTSATSGTAVSATGDNGSVVNDGAIIGTGLSVGVGIVMNGGTVTNSGSIVGLGGTAIRFGGTTSNRLILTSASVISGVVSAANTASNTLELTGPTSGATLSGYTAGYIGFQTVQVDAGSTWEIAGTNTLAALINDGTVTVGTTDHLTVGSAVTAAGSGGTFQVSGHGVLTLNGAVDASETAVLNGTTAELVLGTPGSFAGSVSGFNRGDIIDLATVALSGTTATLSGSQILVTNGGNTYAIGLTAPVVGSALNLLADANGNTEITLVPPVTEALASDTGFSSSDLLTHTATLTGLADPNATVRLTENGTQIATATADGSGVWTATPSLADGRHTVVATDTDAGGNTGTATLTFTLDTQAPSRPTLVLAAASDSNVAGDNVTNVTTPTLGGSAETGSLVSLYDGGSLLGTTTAVAGAWSFPVSATLTDGTHVLTATATDPAGNVSAASTALNLVIDTMAPGAPPAALAATSDSGTAGDGITNVTRPAITGTGVAGDIVTLYDGATAVGSATVAGNGTYSVAPISALQDGNHGFTVTETDLAGNVSMPSAAVPVTIDTVRPATLAAPVLDPGSDSGTAGDALTNVTRPAFTGTGAPGDTVTLNAGGVVVGTGTVLSDGTFSVTPTAALADGLHSFTVTQTDAVGNVSLASPALLVTTKTVPDAAPVLALAPMSDTGVAGDDVTRDTTPAIDGTGTAGDLARLYDGATVVGTATVAANGTFSITPGTALGDGVHNFTATVTDAAGNVSAASAVLGVTIDTVAPAATTTPVLAPASDSGIAGDGITNAVRPAVTGTGVAGNTVTLYNGNVAVGTGTIASDGTFSVAPSQALADGSYSFVTTQTDPAGNTSVASAPVTVVIDTVPPAAPSNPVLDPATDSGNGDGYTNATRPDFTGTGVAGNTVTLYNMGTAIGTARIASDGSFSVSPTAALADGPHLFTITQTDTNGNVSPVSSGVALYVKATPPAALVPVLSPASDSGVAGDDLTNVVIPAITGTGRPGDTIKLFDGGTQVGAAIVAANGTFSVSPSTAFGDGVHSLTLTATDPANNVSPLSAALAVTIDTALPSQTASLALAPGSDSGVAGDDTTNATRPAITGTGTAGNAVTLYDNGVAVGTGTVAADGTFSVAPAASLAGGTHALTTTQTDPAGNTSPASAALSVTVATSLPAATSGLVLDPGSDSGNGDGYTSATRPAFTGTGASGDTVTLYDGGVAVGTATVQADGTFSVAPAAALADGSHAFTTTQTDYVGNTSPASAPFGLIIKATPPAAPALALDPASDSGVAGDGLTNDTRPAFTGTGVAGDSVTLYDAGSVVGTAIIGPNGHFSVAPTGALADGPHSFTVTETDRAENVSAASGAVGVTVATVLPVALAGLAIAPSSDSGVVGDRVTSNTQPVVTGNGTAGEAVRLYDGATLVGTGTVAADGTFAVAPTAALGDGPHQFTATQTDAVGNTSQTSSVLAVTVDTTAPTAPTGLSLAAASDSGVPGDNITDVTLPAINGLGTAGDTVTLYDAGVAVGTATVGADGSFAVAPTATLANGVHALTVTETDPAGNVSLASIPLGILVDNTPPAIPAGLGLDPRDDSGLSHSDGITNVTRPAVQGTGTAGDTITLYDGGVAVGTSVVGSNGVFSVSPVNPFADGVHSLTITSTSVAGTVSNPSAPVEIVIDTTPPTIAVGLRADTGASATDRVTTNPALSGLADPYAIITLTEGGNVLGTTRSDATGAWSFTPSGLVDGVHTVTATESVTDTAGNAGTGTLSFTLDRSQPAAPSSPALDPASDSGVADGVTNVTRPTLVGIGTPGDTVTLLDGGTTIGSAVVQADGTFAVSPSAALADGVHSLATMQSSGAGVASVVSPSVQITIDTVRPATPAAVQLAPSSDSGVVGDNLTNDAQPDITGTGTAGDTIVLYDGSTVVGSRVVGPDGTFSVAPTTALADGVHHLSVAQTDAEANVSAPSAPVNLTVATAVPAAAGSVALSAGSDSGVAGDGLTNVTRPAVTGTGTPGDTVTLYDDMTAVGTGVVGPDGTFSVAPTTALADGPHRLSTTVTDAAGNVSAPSAPVNLTVATAVPAAAGSVALSAGSDSGVAGDGLTNVTRPAVTGTGTPGDTVTLYDDMTAVGTVVVGPDGTFSVAPTTALADGPHRLSTTVTDAAGNVSAPSAPVNLTVATAAPAAAGSVALSAGSDSGVAGDGLTNVTRPAVTGTGTPGDTVTLYDDMTAVGTVVVGPDGTFSVAPTTALADGPHRLSTTVTDAAGNVSTVSPPTILLIDTMAPEVKGVATSTGLESLNVGQTATFTVELGKAVTVAGGPPSLALSNGATAVYDPAASSGTSLVFSYTRGSGEDTGALTINALSSNGARITDAAGNPIDAGTLPGTPLSAPGPVTGFHPFADLVTSSVSATELITVRATVQPSIPGAYSHLGIGQVAEDGVTYTVTGTSAQVNAALAGVLLSPAAGAPALAGVVSDITDENPAVTSQLNNTGAMGSSLLANTVGEIIHAGSGNDTLTGAAGGTTLLGGPGQNVLVGSTTGSVLIGGTGDGTFFGLGGQTTIEGGGQHDVIVASAGDSTIQSKAGGNTLIGLGTGSNIVRGQGADTIIGGSGTASINVASNSLVGLGSGDSTVFASGGSTVVGGAGSDTIGTDDSVLYFQGSGPTTFIGGAGNSTVVGGTGGHALVVGGAGGGLFSAGSAGGSTVVGGLGATTIFGGGDGDVLFAQGSTGTVIKAASGNETLEGGSSSGNDVFFGGSGNDLVGLGSGSDVLVAGSGAATVVAGSGTDVFAFVKGQAGGAESIVGFKPGQDHIDLLSYGEGEVDRALASATPIAETSTTPAGTMVTLSDGTRIMFDGVAGLTRGTFF